MLERDQDDDDEQAEDQPDPGAFRDVGDRSGKRFRSMRLLTTLMPWLEFTCKSIAGTQTGLTLRFYKDEFFQWERSAYRPVPTKEINAHLNRTAKIKFDAANKFAIEQWEKRGGQR